MQQELKPAIQTLEGKIISVAIAACIPILGYLSGADVSDIDTRQVLEAGNSVVNSVDDLKNLLNMTQMAPAELSRFGKFGSILVFAYKLSTYYLDKRTALKLAIIEANKSLKIDQE